ncbi:carbonic anhydrase [Mycena floridula]|nr:carbonic anhydrase [Mycena floridula]
MSPHTAVQNLFAANAKWASDVDHAEPQFFVQSTKGQSPSILWIGCADSRVPESVITGSKPGDIFVHRNIANQFHLDDDSAQAVLAYAVEHLGVEHVAIVGHTECGGAAACFKACCSPAFAPGAAIATDPSLPAEAPLNRWLSPLTHLAGSLQLSSAPNEEAIPVLVEENVRAQVQNLSKAPIIVNAWANKSAKGKDIWIHGWVYDLASGKLKDLNVTQGPR